MRTSLLDELLGCLEEHRHADWFQRNARAYLEVCELFGRSAAQHHDSLVKRFIEGPSAALDEHGLEASPRVAAAAGAAAVAGDAA